MNKDAVNVSEKSRNSGVSVYMKQSRNPYMLTPHLHNEYEIYYNMAGGKGFFIDDHYYECNPRDLFIIRKLHIHRVAVADPARYIRCVISIDENVTEKLKQIIPDDSALDFLEEAGEKLPVKIRLSGEEHERFLMHIKEYMRLEQSDDCLLLTAKLFEILAFIKYSFHIREGKKVEESVPEMWSEKAVYYLERHFRECQVSDIATALNINENYLSRVFRTETGTALSAYIIERKIAEAKKLLYGGASVKNACTMSGFNDCSNFIRTFKKFTGISPGTLKKV